QFVGRERVPKDELVDLVRAVQSHLSRQVGSKPESNQVYLGGARYFLEFLDSGLYVVAPACKVSLASVAIGVAGSKVVEPKNVKTGSNKASGQLAHGTVGKDLLVAHGMAKQRGLDLAGIRLSRFIVAEKASFTTTEVKRSHFAHALG